MTFKVLSMLILAALLAGSVQGVDRDYATVAFKSVDTGLGFSLSVPEHWAKGAPSGNNKLIVGSQEDDFAVIVADFGPAQQDRTAADAVYRDSFLRNGMTVTTETELEIGGKPYKRFILSIDTPSGPGHVEAVMVTVGDETFAVLAITPAAKLEARRAAIVKIFSSIVYS